MFDDSNPTTRRAFIASVGRLAASGIAIGSYLTAGLAQSSESGKAKAGPASNEVLEKSPFVYISPLRSDGQESKCHAELWYAWLDDSVVVIVASDRWKAVALDRGLDQARIWIGDHGRWKGWLGSLNDSFKDAVHFDARVEKVDDPKVLDLLLKAYEIKYPKEIASWRDVMRSGFADGSRTMLRYRAISNS